MAALTTKSLIVDARIPLPARRLANVVQQLARVSRPQAVRVIHQGAVRVNRRPVKRPQWVLEVGDRIELDLDEARSAPAKEPVKKAPRSAVEILFEDAYLAVVNKPAALLTVPTPHRESQTVISQLNRRLRQRDPRAEAFCIHRLDRGVSGVLVFAKSLDIARTMRDQFAARKPSRGYLAFVAGRLAATQGTIRSHLATDKHLNRYSTGDVSAGELAVTHYRVLMRWPSGQRAAENWPDWPDVTLVSVRLETGRRNQIRVHMAEMGHPVLGDPRYRAATPQGPTGAHPAWPFGRLALHAESLGFAHPVSGQSLEFCVPLPPEFQLLEAKLNRSRGRKT